MDGQPAGIRVRLGVVLVDLLLGLGNFTRGDRPATWKR
jgi:hypothetical protein